MSDWTCRVRHINSVGIRINKELVGWVEHNVTQPTSLNNTLRI